MELTITDFWSLLSQNPTIIVTVILTLSVIFVNGWTDAPNAIATCVATRAIGAGPAILMAAVMNFLGVFVMTALNAKVAMTIYNMVDFGTKTQDASLALCAALVAIVVWAVAAMLNECFTDFHPQDVAGQMDRIHAVEHEADGIRHAVIEQLSREFVSPIEREDIFALVQQFDHVVDSIDEVVRKVGMYRIQKLRSDVTPFTELLCRRCGSLARVTDDFADFKKSKTIGVKLIEVNHIEAQADTLHFNAVSELFDEPVDPVSSLHG